MQTLRLAAMVVCACVAAEAQLSRDQKMADFRNLAANFAKRYAPYEWKKQVFGFDGMDIEPYMARVAATRNDQEFFDLCYEYVASFRDAHVQLSSPSDFSANLGFSLDVYDGRVVIDWIQRPRLPEAQYPFQVGDELVSLDGRTADEWITALSRYREASNPRATRRLSSGVITMRDQFVLPSTASLGDTAEVVIRRRGGAVEQYTIPWLKLGTPLPGAGPVPDTTGTRARPAAVQPSGPFAPLRKLMYSGIQRSYSTANLGTMRPIFSLPDGFEERAASADDAIFSGTYQAGGRTLGFLRIPHFEPGNLSAAMERLDEEIAWMQQHTDGLVLDLMNNPGGLVIFQTEIARRLIPRPFRPMGHEMRATAEVVKSFTEGCGDARASGAADWQIAQCRAMLDDVLTAYRENRGRTGPLPLDFLFVDTDLPAVGDLPPAKVVYTKPILALINELSISCADALPAVLQDNQAATLFGTRTAGAGGTVTAHEGTVYSELTLRLTIGLMVRSKTVITPDFPATNYVENVGVRPDIEEDYQTMDNLLHGGKTYVEHFTAAILAAIAVANGR